MLLNQARLHLTPRRESLSSWTFQYRAADKSLARPGRKQAWKHVRDARELNNMETRAIIMFFFLQGKAPKEIHAILTEILDYFLPGRAKDLSASLYVPCPSKKAIFHSRNNILYLTVRSFMHVAFLLWFKWYCSLVPSCFFSSKETKQRNSDVIISMSPCPAVYVFC